MVFGRFFNFVKRHKKKFFYLGIITAGGYACAKYLLKKWEESREEKVSDMLVQVRKQYHFESNERTYSATVAGMVTAFRTGLLRELDCEALTTQLKSKPDNKVQIWERLKCMATARAIAAIYGACLLVVALRVQLSLLGGCIYYDSIRHSGSHPTAADTGDLISNVLSVNVQQKYLESLHYLLNDGLKRLVQVVSIAVDGLFSRTSLKQGLTYGDVGKLIGSVRASVEGNDDHLSRRAHTLLTFLFPDDGEEEGAVALSRDEIIIRKIVGETKDIIASADFHLVLGASLDKIFAIALEKVAQFYLTTSAQTASSVTDCYAQAVPLAKLLPLFSGLAMTVLVDPPNAFVQELLDLDCAKAFGHNIYEAFCQVDRTL